MSTQSKSRLQLAIAGALGTATLALAPAISQAQPPLGDSPTNTGQIATGFYIAQPEVGWTTLFNVTNTTGNALAVKVRIKEYKNSRDALDYWIMLSPYDVWTGWIQQDGDGVYVYTNDNSCTSPLFEGGREALRTQAFYGPAPINADDGGSTNDAEALDRLKMGHVEFVVAGECDYDVNGVPARCAVLGSENPDTGERFPGIGYLTEHVNGVPRDCATADNYFRARPPLWVEGTPAVPGDGNPIANAARTGVIPVGYSPVTNPAPIKVNIAYLQAGTGTGAAIDAMHLDNVIPAGTNLISAQDYPYNQEPNIATAPRGLWNMQGLLALEQRFTWTNSLQEWSVNPANGVQTSIMLNFPTKGYHVDQQCNEQYASNNRWRYNGRHVLACANANDANLNNGIVAGVDYSPSLTSPGGAGATGNPNGTRAVNFYPTLAPFPRRWANGSSNILYTFDAYDREEFFVDETEWSPNREITTLPWEVALISFDPNGGAFGVTSGEVYIDVPEVMSAAAGYDINTGWIDVFFASSTGYGGYPAGVAEDVHGRTFKGLPHHGMMIKTRNIGEPGTAYGQGTVNGYRWEADLANGL
jgi:hypothetical protein